MTKRLMELAHEKADGERLNNFNQILFIHHTDSHMFRVPHTQEEKEGKEGKSPSICRRFFL